MGWDVFVSYGHADDKWVRTLAENLHQAALDVFFDEWEIGPGDVLVHRLDQGLRDSRNGILVVSPESLARPWVQAEYAALITRAIDRRQLLIPVLLKDAEMPPLLATRLWVDFRTADGPDYLAQVAKLVRALKGERPGPPPRNGEAKLPPGGGYVPAGPRQCRLAVALERVELHRAGKEVVAAAPSGRVEDLADLAARLSGLAAGAGLMREAEPMPARTIRSEAALREIGAALADAFLPPAVAEALAAELAEMERLNGALELALDLAEPLADLPWETLSLPGGGPLALHPRVALFRKIATGGAAPAVAVPGPLRILVAIGSPEVQASGADLLDMEAELARILDATDQPRRQGKAFVHILETGSVAAIHRALAERRYHVLHVSCHAGPGVLILEDADGNEDKVSAERFWREAIPANAAPPLVVLAGCSTGRDADLSQGGAGRLPGLARTLVARGVPTVIAMQAPVGDRYATELMAEVYRDLATWAEPQPLMALNHARRVLEEARQAKSPETQPPPEWPIPAMFTAATPLRLYDPSAAYEEMREPGTPVFDPGVVVRRIGDMVGRRRDLRLIRRALRDPNGAGALIHGIGGVGKSTLAAQVLHQVAGPDGALVVSVAGSTDPDRLFGALASRLEAILLDGDESARKFFGRIADTLRAVKRPWRERFQVLAQTLLPQLRLIVLFDNFEDNLELSSSPAAPGKAGVASVRDADLAELLTEWLQQPGQSRLLITCRYPFTVSGKIPRRLKPFHLGPLSWAETRKLILRLEGLKTLSNEELRRAYEAVGGHPRALEFVDALLRGGQARFDDVAERLFAHLEKQPDIADPAAWCADKAGDLDAALAETVTLAATDVLLDQLLERLADLPLARRLLLGSSVYRVPVDATGLIWQVGEAVVHPPDPARAARIAAVTERLKAAKKDNPGVVLNNILSPAEGAQWNQDMRDERRPPMAAPTGFAAARQRLLDLSLLAPVRFSDSQLECFQVHRWTASALASHATDAEQRAADRAAFDFWRWRAKSLLQEPLKDIADLLEARHHLHRLGDLEELHAISGFITHQLHTWGAWEWEERLLHETLGWMPEASIESATILHSLGSVAQVRGDYDAAVALYQRSLAVWDRLGVVEGKAATYAHLGMVACDRGDFKSALDWYQKSLEIHQQEDDKLGIAKTYHEFGMIAMQQGEVEAGLDWTRKSIAIFESEGYPEEARESYHHLGIIACIKGDYATARVNLLKALSIRMKMDDRAGIAASYHELGVLAQEQKQPQTALDYFKKSLEIKERLGNLGGIAISLRQIGALLTEIGRAAEAVPYALQSLSLYLRMQRPQEVSVNLHFLSLQRRALGAGAFRAIVARNCDAETTAAVLALIDRHEASQHGGADSKGAASDSAR